MNACMLIDFGSTFTKVTGVDLDERCILGTAKSFTTINEGILIGLNKAIALLEEKIGPRLWTKKLACSSAAGGLKMVAVGIVPDLTAKAAKEAALSAGAKVMKVFSMELTEEDLDVIGGIQPDIILLTGGTDGGNKKILLHNARMLGQSAWKPPIIFAGNKSVKKEALSILESAGFEVMASENVMPTLSDLNIEPARAAIQKVFLDKIILAKGIKEAEKVIDNVLMPTPLAVMKAAELLSLGTDQMEGLGDLLVVDIGGATTDIHSVCEGLPKSANVVHKGIEEPFVKRSVEGDLGARYSLVSAVETRGLAYMSKALDLTAQETREIIDRLIDNPGLVAEEMLDDIHELSRERLKAFDQVLAEIVVSESVARHAGILKEHYTPFGMTYEQFGKDLRDVNIIIGTGGPLIHADHPRKILAYSTYEENQPMILKPKAKSFLLDAAYIMSAIGLLSETDPEVAFDIMNKNLKPLRDNEGVEYGAFK